MNYYLISCLIVIGLFYYHAPDKGFKAFTVCTVAGLLWPVTLLIVLILAYYHEGE